MGYSHYTEQLKDCPPHEWEQITTAFKKLNSIALLNNQQVIQREADNSALPHVDEHCIVFNGIGDDAHETFVLEGTGRGFNCCKTARKPYDDYVTAVLTLAQFYSPDTWIISSDGEEGNWVRGHVLAQQVDPSCPPINLEE